MKIHYNFEYCEFEYEPDDDKLEEALIEILCENVKTLNKNIYNKYGAYQMAVYMLKLLKQDLDYDISEMFGEWFEEELKQYFYRNAYEQYKEDIAKEENDRYYDLHKHN